VGAPIVVNNRVWGAMIASSMRPEPLPLDSEARIAEFTDLVATAISNAQARTELAESRARLVAAADETRRRIERDLHDGTQQRLVTLGLELRAAEADVPPDHRELEDAFSHAAEGLSEVLDDLREISRGIHPAILSEGGLGPAMKALARRSAIPVELDTHLETRLPESVEVTAYFVASEALANAAKHAQASLARIEVRVEGVTLHLSITDDGVGSADPARGSGLVGLTDRVEALEGTLTLVSPAGEGTTMRVELPVQDG
jgi:signal transduction histidine kinase